MDGHGGAQTRRASAHAELSVFTVLTRTAFASSSVTWAHGALLWTLSFGKEELRSPWGRGVKHTGLMGTQLRAGEGPPHDWSTAPPSHPGLRPPRAESAGLQCSRASGQSSTEKRGPQNLGTGF